MKEYYYLSGKTQNGPFTLKELKDKGLTSETLVWTESMENWQKLKDVPDLLENLNYKKVPPPPPSDTEVKTDKAPNSILEYVKPSNKALRFFLIWSSIHLFALITSYSEIKLFNSRKPMTGEFWPFVKIFESRQEFIGNKVWGTSAVYYDGYFDNVYDFNGLFYRYDWSEFSVYVGGALLIFLYLKTSNKESI